MPTTALTVTHGDLVLIEGDLAPNVKAVLKRAGAFEGEGGWVCLPEHWGRVETLLRGVGLAMEVIGEPAVPKDPVVVEARPKAASMSLEGGRIRIQGDMPKPVRAHWLGSERSSGHVGMSPWAIEDFAQACKEQNIALSLEPAVQSLRDRLNARRKAVDAVLAAQEGPEVPLAASALRPYQAQAVAFGEACNGRFLIADTVGGGKTLEAIAWARHVQSARTLVICPSIVKGNWRDEVRRFDGSAALILDGFADNGPRLTDKHRWVITNYDTLQDREDKKGRRTSMGWLQYLKAWKPTFVIADESHMMKGRDSERSQGVRELARAVADIVPMSGTPRSNNNMDLWAQLDALEPGWWGTWYEFGKAFCDGQTRKRWFGKGKFHEYFDTSGSSNEDVLNARMRYVVIRRTMSEIGIQMPPQTRIRQLMDLSPEYREKYDSVSAEYRALLDNQRGVEEQAALSKDAEHEHDVQIRTRSDRMKFVMKLRQISSKGRIEGTVDFVANLVEQGKRPVIFAYFTEVLHGLRDGLAKKGLKVGFIDGSVSRPQRDQVREEFVGGKLHVLVGQTEAAGVGINLQDISDTTVTHELTYKPIDIEQTEGRVYRSGQKRPTFHYYCLGEGTRDQRTLDVVLEKMATGKAVMDAEDAVRAAIEADFFQERR